MSDFTTAKQLAGFLYESYMEREALERYIQDFADYYYNMRMMEIVADMRANFEEARSINQTKTDETNDNRIVLNDHYHRKPVGSC